MKRNYQSLILVSLIFCFVQCRKEPVNIGAPDPDITDSGTSVFHARTTNSFGQPLPDSFSCLTKQYTTSPDTAIVLTYDSLHLLLNTYQPDGYNGTIGSVSSYYTYDTLSRLTAINDGVYTWSLKYGSDDRVETIIRTDGPARDTIFCNYPDPYTITGKHWDWLYNMEMRDTMQFDPNYNLIRNALTGGPAGGPYALLKIETITFNPGVKAVFRSSVIQDYLMIVKLFYGSDFDVWPVGANLGTDSNITNYLSNAPDTIYSHSYIIDMESDADQRPAMTKYRVDQTYNQTGTPPFVVENSFLYDCN